MSDAACCSALLKNAAFRLYKHSGAARAAEALVRRTAGPFMAVLLFHRVTDAIPPDGLTVGTARFRAVCDMLRHGFRVVPLGEVFDVLRRRLPVRPRTVAITFDDCYRDNLAAAHTLAEHGLPATFFVPTGVVGTDLGNRSLVEGRQGQRTPKPPRPMAEQIERLRKSLGG